MENALKNQTILITGITDQNSLALRIAEECKRQGATLICTGLGKSKFHSALSENAQNYLERTFNDFTNTVKSVLGADTKTYVMDVSIQDSINEFASTLASEGIELNGFLHSIAMDKTIRAGKVKPIMEVTREEFMDAMNISAYSMLAVIQSLYAAKRLAKQASLVALSYLGAEKIVSHPYKNIGIAKAALERLIKELAIELGKSDGIQVNGVRFSPYTASKAGGAIQGLEEAVKQCEELAPLGNANASDLAYEVVYLFRKNNRITGEIRHVDGGYHIRG
ncbi:enoyl-ACP reductase [Leptospira ryugenii]|uniref:enoyl-[acyl-carrier-protein] reductase (NADH) n=1 Tax=Leptospira ryugenii TaxID=1917863 RepID=A0A2P2DVB5_9LEPT|nr:SDR family oxidoreductase [Leptospira ryugenii]GBF48554.1 enoyl-ACP reductase [Leptospira ryugenii]